MMHYETYYMLKINWNQVLTTVIATFFAAIIVSAAAVVWKGATSVEDQVKKQTANIESTANYAKKAVDLLAKEIEISRTKEESLESTVEQIRAMISIMHMNSLSNTNFVHRERGDPFEEIGSFTTEKNPVSPIESEFNTNQSIQQRLPSLEFKR
jgi:hypothetical protein